MVKEVITIPILSKNKIDTINKTEKSQASNKKSIQPEEINRKKLNQ